MHTHVASVQDFGHYRTWGPGLAYVGMPGLASVAFGIPYNRCRFGKPWELKDDPRGWAAAYAEYLAKRLLVDERFYNAALKLHGKTLLCYCTRKAQNRGVEVACHARILAETVELMFHAGEASE